jgi:hypothetical protein
LLLRTAACDFYQFCSAGDDSRAAGDQLPINRTIFSKETVSKVNFAEQKNMEKLNKMKNFLKKKKKEVEKLLEAPEQQRKIDQLEKENDRLRGKKQGFILIRCFVAEKRLDSHFLSNKRVFVGLS